MHPPKFQHATPAFRTYCGADALKALPGELDRLGVRRAVVFCGASVRRHPAFSRVAAALGERMAGIFDGVHEHSPVPAVEDGRTALAQTHADAVIAIGGGSAVVTARAASILLAENRDVRELCTRREANGQLVSPRLLAPKLPQWVVPTTPTTAYAKAGSAVRDPARGERLALFDPKTRAQGIFLDPELALSAPQPLAQAAALNAFSMAVEALQSNFDDPLAEALLTQALRMLMQWLPLLRQAPDQAEPRLRLMLAALLCGQGTDYASGGLAQALAHAAGPRSAAANGVVEALLLPHSMRYNAPATAAGLARIASVLHASDGSAGPQAIENVERFLQDLQVPARLRDLGVASEALREIAEHAKDDWALSRSPRQAGVEELELLLRAAW